MNRISEKKPLNITLLGEWSNVSERHEGYSSRRNEYSIREAKHQNNTLLGGMSIASERLNLGSIQCPVLTNRILTSYIASEREFIATVKISICEVKIRRSLSNWW